MVLRQLFWPSRLRSADSEGLQMASLSLQDASMVRVCLELALSRGRMVCARVDCDAESLRAELGVGLWRTISILH